MVDEFSLEKLLKSLNRHVPLHRRTLAELLEMEEPCYTGRDGVVYHMKREELEKISGLINTFEWGRLRLPIYIATDTSYPGGAWKVMGKLETRIISAILNKKPEKEDEMRLFFPHLGILREILPTTTVVFFMP